MHFRAERAPGLSLGRVGPGFVDTVLSSDPSGLYVDGRASESRRAILPVSSAHSLRRRPRGHRQRDAVLGLADAIVRCDGYATDGREPHGRLPLPPDRVAERARHGRVELEAPGEHQLHLALARRLGGRYRLVLVAIDVDPVARRALGSRHGYLRDQREVEGVGVTFALVLEAVLVPPAGLADALRPRWTLLAEIALLRHQLTVLQRSVTRARVTRFAA